MVSVLDFGVRGPCSSPGGSFVLLLCKTLNSHSASLHPGGVKWVPANCQENLTKCWEVACDGLASHPGGVAILA